MRWAMSLRARITTASTIAAVLLLAAASAIVYVQLTVIITEKERAVLHGITEVYRGVIEEDPNENFEQPGVKQHVAIVAPDGTTRMNTLPNGLAARVDEIILQGPRLHSIRSEDASYYVYVDPVETAEGTWYVVATRDTDIADDVLTDVVRLMLLVLGAGAVVFAVGSWFVTGAALRPVERMRRSAESLAVARHGELLPVGTERDELSDLAATLNGLLERTRAANDRERRMVSDASHELRTPLAVLTAQLGLIDGADAAADAITVREARETLRRLTRIAESLLQLSRIAAVEGTGEATVADLATAVTDAVDRLRLGTGGEGPQTQADIDFQLHIADDTAVADITGDDFSRIVDNLVGNAIGAAGGSTVRVLVVLTTTATAARLDVRDDAGGFDPAIADHAFERFVRGPSATYAGSGLGLAIVAALAERSGGAATIETRHGLGATVTVTLPLSPGCAVPSERSENTHQR